MTTFTDGAPPSVNPEPDDSRPRGSRDDAHRDDAHRDDAHHDDADATDTGSWLRLTTAICLLSYEYWTCSALLASCAPK